MSLETFALVLLAAAFHALWNLLAKRAADAGATFVSAYNTVICVAYAPIVWWILENEGMAWTPMTVACIAASAAATLGYSLALQRGYRLADFSVVFPVARGTGPLLAGIVGFLLLGEVATGLRVFGLILAVAGILLIATQGNFSGLRSPRARDGLIWGAITGAFVACYSVVDAWAVKVLSISPLMLVWFANVFRFPILAALAMRNPSRSLEAMRGRWWLAIFAGITSPWAYLLVLMALEKGAPLSVVAPMREISLMIAALLGMVLLKEAVGPWRLVGCATLLAGVIALGTST